MALSANSVFEVRTAGSDTNGGGFVTGAAGTDYSQQDAKNTALGVNDSKTDAVAVGTGVITSATANFSSAIVGNIIYLQGGTGGLAAGWYQVTVFTSATSITVDRNVAAGTGITMNIGGALVSPGMAGGVGLVTGNIIYIKAGTYSITSATINISGGCFSSALNLLIIQGYQTTRGDLGTSPVLQASGISSFTIITITGFDSQLSNIEVNGNNLSTSVGISGSGLVYKCIARNLTGDGFTGSGLHIQCLATGCGGDAGAMGFDNGKYFACISHDNICPGFRLSSNNFAVHCIADSNTGASSDGFVTIGSGGLQQIINCNAYANGRDGIRIAGGDSQVVFNSIGENNTGYGILIDNRDNIILLNNATYNNTAGGISVGTGKGILNISAVAGTASFFTSAVGQDFSLNNLSGGGALARSVGYPGVMPAGGTGYLDIGALQHLGIPFFMAIGATILRSLR